ncbi:MAG TPA: sodium:proton antiporter [Verrucomicrobiae bacterium]|nr:sodium:proton antiporter [Verrucomicrobiae bacterium]
MEHPILQPTPWIIVPFGVLLLAIALAPLFFAQWWHKHYPKLAFFLAAVTVSYYLFVLKAPVPVAHVAHEYLSFIALVGSLFVVSGGIHIRVKGEATPAVNVFFLFIGAVIANVLGTTGASMLLIRPWIRMNKYRITAHHIVFFIFIVSNIGGCLTPIGDPPLFIGYLKGVPFWWVLEHCLPIWLTAVVFMLLVFFIVDRRNYLKAPRDVRAKLAEPGDEWKFDGLSNIIFLGVILGSVFIEKPAFLREGLMVAAALGSYFFTRKEVHHANAFNFEPIKEVAILFIGIFATMLPALDWLQHNAKNLGMTTPGFFYWGSGLLSSALDNAPTYYSFLTAITGVFVQPEVVLEVQRLIAAGVPDLSTISGLHAEDIKLTIAALQQYHPIALASGKLDLEQVQIAYLLGKPALNHFIVAISVGSVFFGANTYIGNGPNFMVKSIADHAKIHTPGFLGFIGRYSLPYMLPMLVLIWLLFFH